MSFKRFYSEKLETLQTKFDILFEEWSDFRHDYNREFFNAILSRIEEIRKLNAVDGVPEGDESPFSYIDVCVGDTCNFDKAYIVNLGHYLRYTSLPELHGQKMVTGYYNFLNVDAHSHTIHLTRIDDGGEDEYGTYVDDDDNRVIYGELARLGFFEDDFANDFEVL